MHFVLMVILVYIILEDKSWYIVGQFFFNLPTAINNLGLFDF